MTLRVKVVIAVLVALVVSGGMIYGLSRVILIREIRTIETAQMTRDVSVAQRALDRELSELDTRVFDYAAWDDSYDFVQDPTQAYIESNLPDNVYESFAINLLAYVRFDGTVVYGRAFDLEDGVSSELAAGLAGLWDPSAPFLSAASEGNALSGAVKTPTGTFLIACRPILTSKETGPPRGMLVMGRLLDGSLIESLNSQTQLNMTLKSPDDPGISADVASSLLSKGAQSGTLVKPLDSHTIAGYKGINDISGEPVLVLEVQAPRVTHEQGERAVTKYMLLVMGIVLALGIGLNLALSRWILVPLRRLVAQVRRLASGQSGGASGRIAVSTGAEFNALGMEINHLLGELEVAHEEISQLYGLAREQADRDSVTGLLSRHAVFEALENRLSLTRERGGKLALLMIDVDGFKLFNDSHGHLAGDTVLQTLARALTLRTRDGDLVGRLGGDEFLVVLPNTDAEGAVVQAERLLAATDLLTWSAPDGAGVPISLSIGVSAFPTHGSELNELLAFADSNLYAVKQNGRGAVSLGASANMSEPDGYGFGMLDSLITALSEKDRYTRRHAEGVASHAVRIAEALGLEEKVIRAVRIAGLLHDVGKTGIPASLLLRPGPLTPEETSLVRRHVEIGVALIRDVPELDEVLRAVACHHEHIDGSGYPRGLMGDHIPLTGRILAVADSYSAMVSFRPYRRAHTPEQAEQELRTMAGVELDQRLVEIFLSACCPRPSSEQSAVPVEAHAPARADRVSREGVSPAPSA